MSKNLPTYATKNLTVQKSFYTAYLHYYDYNLQ